MGCSPVFLSAILLLSAAGSNDPLAEARAAIGDLEYDQAALLLQDAIVAPEVSEDNRLQAHRLLGSVEVIRGRFSQAEFHFRWVLKRQPDATLPDSEPLKVRSFFQQVKDQMARENQHEGPEREDDEPPLLPWLIGGAAGALGVVAVVAAAAGVSAYVVLTQPSLGTVDYR